MPRGNTALKMLKATAGIGAGAGLIYGSTDKITGEKTLYHGTSLNNAKLIKEQGLRTDKGGSGGTSDVGGIKANHYRDVSKGRVYATARKSKAKAYAKIAEGAEDWRNSGNYKELDALQDKYTVHDEKSDKWKIVFPKTEKGQKDRRRFEELRRRRNATSRATWIDPFEDKGKVFKIKVPYDKWKNKFEVDPDEKGGWTKGKGKLLEHYGKDIAGRTRENITKDEIVGLHNPKDRLKKRLEEHPEYVKNNPGRFATGVGMASGGAYLVGKNVNNIKKQIKDTAKKKQIKKAIKHLL